MSKQISFPLPHEVKTFFHELNKCVGEFCHEAVLSYMLNMVLRGFTRTDDAADSNVVDCMLSDLTDGGVIDDSIEGLPDSAYNVVLSDGCSAIYALGIMVRKYKLDESLEIAGVTINNAAEVIVGRIK